MFGLFVVVVEHSLELRLVFESARYGASYFGSEVVKCAQAGVESNGVLGRARCSQRVLLGRHFFSLLELAKVVLDEERSVELANCHIIVTFCCCCCCFN